MDKNVSTRIKRLQIILWAALAVLIYSTQYMEDIWQSGVFSVITFVLLCSYSYKKNPTSKHLKGLSIATGIFCAGVIILYILDRIH